MAAVATCLPQVQGCAIRVVNLNSLGVPVQGANQMYTSDMMSKLTITPVYTDADEIKEKNACGTVKINYKGAPSFDRADFELELLTPDPQLIDIMTNASVISDANNFGGGAPPIGDVTGVYFAMEIWSKQIRNGVIDPTYPYARWAFPGCKNTRFGAFSFDEGAKKIVISGEMYENTGWFNGPTNDWTAASDRVWQWIPATTLPTAQCGYQTVAVS